MHPLIVGFLFSDSSQEIFNSSDPSVLLKVLLAITCPHPFNLVAFYRFNVQVYFSLYISAQASSSTLYMPEPEDAVAHGDASLAVDDFLARTDGHAKRCSSNGPAVDTP
jgi:hypothetical protein